MLMQRFRATSKLLPHLSANKISPMSSSLVLHHPYPKRPCLGPLAPYSSSWPKDMSVSTSSSSSVAKQAIMPEDGVEQIELLSAVEDLHGGVVVELKEVMDSEVFSSLLRASMSQWKQKGKKGVWIKLPIELSNLVDAAVKEGFRYHHAEPDYLMLVRWIPETIDTLPANASHRVGIGAFVMNSERKIPVVQEISGRFKDTGLWKMPTGVVNEGEDICAAAVREVKEETGIDTEFVEILAVSSTSKEPSTRELKEHIFSFIAMLAGLLQLKQGVFDTDYLTLVSLVVALVVYRISFIGPTYIRQAHPNSNLPKLMDKISLPFGALALVLELVILVRVLGLAFLCIWIVWFAKLVHPNLKTLYESAGGVEAFEKLNEYLKNMKMIIGRCFIMNSEDQIGSP